MVLIVLVNMDTLVILNKLILKGYRLIPINRVLKKYHIIVSKEVRVVNNDVVWVFFYVFMFLEIHFRTKIHISGHIHRNTFFHF